jgi:hypothetical protein
LEILKNVKMPKIIILVFLIILSNICYSQKIKYDTILKSDSLISYDNFVNNTIHKPKLKCKTILIIDSKIYEINSCDYKISDKTKAKKIEIIEDNNSNSEIKKIIIITTKNTK